MENVDTFAKIHEALCAKLEKALPGFKVFREYPRGSRSDLQLPAVFSELVSLDVPEDGERPSGDLVVRAQFETRVMMATKRKERRSIWAHAAKVMLLIRNETWSLEGVYQARVVSSADDGLDPEAEGFEVWLISWWQDARVESLEIWDDEEFRPKALERVSHKNSFPDDALMLWVEGRG